MRWSSGHQNPHMDLNEKATSARDVVRAGETEAQWYRLEDSELTDASEIGGENEFPQFGDFLDVTATDSNGDDLGPRWVECPGGLARELVENDIGEGDRFAVESVEKTDDDAWSFTVKNGVEDA